jgi:hypothetical protein
MSAGRIALALGAAGLTVSFVLARVTVSRVRRARARWIPVIGELEAAYLAEEGRGAPIPGLPPARCRRTTSFGTIGTRSAASGITGGLGSSKTAQTRRSLPSAVR